VVPHKFRENEGARKVFDGKPERKRRRGRSWPTARLGYGGGGDAFTCRESISA
jgi:hypothetical protein